MTYPLTRSAPDSQRELWDDYPLPSLIGGINTQERADALNPNQVVDAVNVFTDKMELRADTGYVQLGTGAVADSMFKRCIEYNKSDGTVTLIGITKGSVYVYSTTQAEWQYVKGTASTTLVGAFILGDTALAVVSSAGFLAGEKIGIILTNGKQYRTTVSSIPDGTHITIGAPGLPSGSSNGGAVVRAVVLNGSDNFPVMAVNVPSNYWLAFTNNVDYVMRYDGADCVVVPGLVTTTCVDVKLYNSALLLLNTTEGGVSHPTRIRRSEIGSPTTWTGGTAGFDDLLDTLGEIVGGDTLGPYFIVYKKRTVYRGSFINTGGKNYQWDAMLHGEAGEGLVATNALVNAGSYHLIIGNANVYRYLGDFSLTPVGDAVFELLFSADAPVNTGRLPLAFGVFVEGLQEAWFFYPSTDSVWPDQMIRYNTKTEAWLRRKFSHSFTSAALYSAQVSFTWNDLVGSWSDQTWEWNSRIASGTNRPMVLLSPFSLNQVYIYDFITPTDGGQTFSSLLETRDFLWAGGQFRTDRIEMYLQGLNTLIQYSTDQGVSWNTWEAVSNSLLSRVHSYKQVVCDTLRYRFTSSDPNFRIRWMKLTWKPESV